MTTPSHNNSNINRAKNENKIQTIKRTSKNKRNKMVNGCGSSYRQTTIWKPLLRN